MDEKKILQQIEEHKRAIIYSFFDSFDDLSVKRLEMQAYSEERIRAVVAFEDEKKVIYENSDLKIEQGFRKYITWFNNEVLQNKKLYCKNILSYKNCGFIENIEEKIADMEEQKQDYYYRLGCIIAIVSALNVEIVEVENIIEMNDQPVIKDITKIFKAYPIYYQNEETGKIMFEEFESQCPIKYRMYMKDGYEYINTFMRENDIRDIVKLCFGELI